MHTLWQDLRYAARMLRKQPSLTIIVVLSIGIGIGANTTVFAWMESLLLNPAPLVKDSGRLVAINSANADGSGGEAMPFSYLTYLDWRDAAQSFDGLIAQAVTRVNLRLPEESQGEAAWVEIVSGNYFDLLGVPAQMGRAFTLAEERSAAPVVVINYNLWQRRFGGDPKIIGQHLLLNGADVTIIGVAPRGFKGVLAGYGYDLWLPLTAQPLVSPGNNHLTNRGDRWLQGTARLKAGMSLAEANREMQAVARQISEAHGEAPVTSAMVKLMRERFAGPLVFRLFTVLLPVAGLVLLIACANVANLLLARSSSRQKEIGVRLALGARRYHIIRQLLIESLMLAGIGGLVGLLFALWAKDLFLLFIPPTPQPVGISFEINGRIVGFALLVAFATAIIFGLVPALRASRPDLVAVLKDLPRGASASSSRLRNALAIAQVALSLVTLVSAGLFLRSLQQARHIDIGFSDPAHLLLVGTDFNAAGLNRDGALALADQLLERARALPGVQGAAFSTMVPLGFSGHNFSGTTVEGYVPAPGEDLSVERVIVSDGYFDTMGIPIVAGRAISPQDGRDSQRVAVVNETFAARYFPGQTAIGRRLNQGPGWATIIGIARDGKYRDLSETTTPIVYSPLRQWYTAGVTLHVRTANSPRALVEPLRHEFATLNVNLPLLDPRTMTEHMSATTFVQLFGGAMLSGFGLFALLLAGIGLYGVLSYVVAQRSREIAIRIAVGATPKDVLGLVLKQGLALVLTGLVIGAALALAAGRLLQSQLLGISANDPLTFVGVTLLLIGVALGACFVPARRATRVDPMVALRYE
ncbi:MAG TPA: ABC transporter permease [Blastocatellia bacterium]|nr:ABC transporter permease [Blastocatellia bacterium]